MSVLESVMRMKELEQQKMQFQQAQTMSLIDSFVKQAQQRRAEEITLATAGIKRTPEGFVRDESLMSEADKLIQLGKVALASKRMRDAGLTGLGIENAGGYQSGEQTSQPNQVGNGLIMSEIETDEYGRTKSTKWKSKDSLAERKFSAEQEKIAETKKKATDLVTTSAQDTLSTIGEIEKGMGFFGPLGNIPSLYAPSTLNLLDDKTYGQRKNWEANVNKLKGKLVLEIMNNMKSASKTGATGFGQLNKEELTLLKDSANALSKTLVPEDAKRYINQIKVLAKKVLEDKGSISREKAIEELKRRGKYNG